MSLPTIAHVPMALSVQSSTLMTVAQEIIDVYAGDSLAVLSHNRDVRLENAKLSYVDYTRNCPREWFARRELAVDVATGRLGLLRPYYGRMYDPAIDAVRDSDADVVLLYEGHYASATLPRWQRVRSSRRTVCLYVHNPVSRSYGRRELERLLASADRVIFCAEHQRRDVVNRLGHDDPRLEVVPNGVNPEFFVDEERDAPDAFDVLFVGRIAPDKGAHLVLAAAELLPASLQARLTVRFVGSSSYGGGAPSAYEEELRTRAAAAPFAVEFTGWRTRAELPAEYRRAAVLCTPSQGVEGLPLVALEAMASGTPVVCSDAPGFVEAVGDAGFVAARGDAAALAEHLVALGEDPRVWREASSRSRLRAGGYTWLRTAALLAGQS